MKLHSSCPLGLKSVEVGSTASIPSEGGEGPGLPGCGRPPGVSSMVLGEDFEEPIRS